MSEWRDQIGPRSSSSPVPPGAARLPDPYHRKELFTACKKGEEVRVEVDTELTYDPAPPAPANSSIIKTTIRTIHTGRQCPDGQEGEQVAWPGGITFPSPLPPPPTPPEKDKYKEQREAEAEFERQWERASTTPPRR